MAVLRDPLQNTNHTQISSINFLSILLIVIISGCGSFNLLVEHAVASIQIPSLSLIHIFFYVNFRLGDSLCLAVNTSLPFLILHSRAMSW
jgi:hypothetical protein